MKLIIKDIRVFAHHGVLPEEREKGQHFLIDVEMDVDAGRAVESDELGRTVDYAMVCEAVAGLATDETFDLIETLASRIADLVLTFHGVRGVTVTVRKPEAPLPVEVGWVGASITRSRSLDPPSGGGPE